MHWKQIFRRISTLIFILIKEVRRNAVIAVFPWIPSGAGANAHIASIFSEFPADAVPTK